MTWIDDAWRGECVVAGSAAGPAAWLDEPLSFWGGFDTSDGVVIEPAHPQRGLSLAGKVLVMAQAKGSSSSSSVLAEAIRNGTGPVAIVMRERDLIVALGCIVADELYGRTVPLAVLGDEAWNRFAGSRKSCEMHVECRMGSPALITRSGRHVDGSERLER